MHMIIYAACKVYLLSCVCGKILQGQSNHSFSGGCCLQVVVSSTLHTHTHTHTQWLDYNNNNALWIQ